MSAPSIPAGGGSLQTRLPRLWLAAQHLFAGFFDRGRHILKHYAGQRRVLEIGCSVGIDSVHFARRPCLYLGVDVDLPAVESARKRYANRPHMRFEAADPRSLDPSAHRFDFILLCGTLHHIPDDAARQVLAHAARLLDRDGRLVVVDYDNRPHPGWLERLILRMEEGEHVRPGTELLAMLRSTPGLRVLSEESFDNAAFLTPWPVMARKKLVLLGRDDDGAAS
ncbi:Ubiquinone biosynthesis O-methyltransferase [Fundidesulfovibrio magnetotacticus]|uniref:Ubiquinone biosynthesis O-methyltransferase n=1 Tax=Fundidesulfovibrio magnetotacticus TaxID=2730080 RepID=A0A6V8LU20_9BACT|nr:class I SAM-dependent methyltransferase [Fundidesulfovibrio magnetotacticus]GFK93828.1 Ubiquinone biosynthesis O-methyltransferase [Fundidesulfovibrio magnetotacticus]